MAVQIHIDMNALMEVMRVGARRASGFMALGTNASDSATAKSFALNSSMTYRFLPDPIPDALLGDLKKEFAQWIIRNGLRELEQHFARFLDGLYEVLLHGDRHEVTDPPDMSTRLRRNQWDTNLAGKLDRIRAEYGIACDAREHFASLAIARNVLAHNLGVVDARHCAGADELALTWWGQDLVVRDQVYSGAEWPEIFMNAGETAHLRRGDRRRAFRIGSELVLSAHDLSEICWMFIVQAEELQQAVTASLLAKGIPKATRPAMPNPPPAATLDARRTEGDAEALPVQTERNAGESA